MIRISKVDYLGAAAFVLWMLCMYYSGSVDSVGYFLFAFNFGLGK